MLAARDLPVPRLPAYAFWAYLIGGAVIFGSLFVGKAPDDGWFMCPPLTSSEYSPGDNADFWLLGIGFIEISAIAGAIELVIGVPRTRARGMTLGRMPIYARSVLVVGPMIIFAFPPVVLDSMPLEVERAFGWPFYGADKGGDPLPWQHLFWLFGHPEVYSIFLPAAGMVSIMVPTMARAPLLGYGWGAMALVATGFLSFGLRVHHTFATGLPALSLNFFSAASMAVELPTGVQVFAWIATFGAGRPSLKDVRTLFLAGFLFIFVLGGLTGVVVTVIPFDWQAHDSYFVVAHLHHVLIGGLMFPLFAAFSYRMPNLTGRMVSERLGRWVFGLMFVGFNVAFLPMHLTGLRGMPRRVYTYPTDTGFYALNLPCSPPRGRPRSSACSRSSLSGPPSSAAPWRSRRSSRGSGRPTPLRCGGRSTSASGRGFPPTLKRPCRTRTGRRSSCCAPTAAPSRPSPSVTCSCGPSTRRTFPRPTPPSRSPGAPGHPRGAGRGFAGARRRRVRGRQDLHVGVTTVMALHLPARVLAGRVAADRLVTVDVVAAFWRYTLVQSVLALAIVHVRPRLLGRCGPWRTPAPAPGPPPRSWVPSSGRRISR